jgi:hypothetical protein
MKVTVKMMAFMDGEERIVDIPDFYSTVPLNELLNKVFEFGQNDFQPQEMCSVSTGDVIVYQDKYYRVAMFGFEELTQEQYDAYLKVECVNRFFWKKEK